MFPSISFDKVWFYYLTFFANIPFIYNEGLPAMDHLWSISVEEQFYLFWPLLFLFLVKRDFMKIVLVLFLLLAFFRIYIWYVAPFSIPSLFSVVNRFDCMLIGGVGGYMFFNKFKIITIIDNKIVQGIAWLIILSMVVNVFWFLNSIIEIFVIVAITLIIIIGQINIKNRIINLENPLISYFGKLSFGIYVYHPLIMFLASKYLKFDSKMQSINELSFAILIYVTVISFTIIIAHISFYYFEIRFLKLKKSFSVVNSTNNKINN